jgi:hypothetical protein
MSASLGPHSYTNFDEMFTKAREHLGLMAARVELAGPVERALEAIETAMYSVRRFDPASYAGVFRFGLNDNHEVWMVPVLLRELQAKAPNAPLVGLYLARGHSTPWLPAATVPMPL